MPQAPRRLRIVTDERSLPDSPAPNVLAWQFLPEKILGSARRTQVSFIADVPQNLECGEATQHCYAALSSDSKVVF